MSGKKRDDEANARGLRTLKVWAWALPTMMPTLLLMIGVHAGEALSPNKEDRDITRFFFGLTLATSAFYILIVMLTILLAPFSSSAPLALMEKSNLWLGPLQGLAAGTFGVFYVHRKN